MLTRQIQVKLVKPSKATGDPEAPKEPLDLDKINEIVADQVFNTGVVVVGAITAVKIVDTFCKIAINVTNPANWR